MTVLATYWAEHFTGVKVLWEEAFPGDPPWNRAEVVILAKVAAQPDLLIVALDSGHVIGAGLAGYDGHRGWLYSVAVSASWCRQRIGTLLVRELERRLGALGCMKINLQILSLNMPLLNFYHRLGYETEDRISMGKRLTP